MVNLHPRLAMIDETMATDPATDLDENESQRRGPAGTPVGIGRGARRAPLPGSEAGIKQRGKPVV